MRQSDLLALLGLAVTDPRLMLFFEERGLMLPESVAIMKPNSSTPVSIKNSWGVQDKGWGFSYYFRSELINENFPILKEGRNYIPYFSEIIFDGKLYQKRERKESPDFWDVSPAPDSRMESITDHFGEFDLSRKYPQLRSSFNNQVEIIVGTLLPEENKINGYFAKLIESYELLHQSEFDPKKGNKLNCYAMLVKWLFDNQYLQLSKEHFSSELSANIASMLKFIEEFLDGHLWENQLVKDVQLRKFIVSCVAGRSGFERKLYTLMGESGDYESLDWDEQKQWIANIPFDDEHYSIFRKAMDQSFKETFPSKSNNT